MAHHARMSNCTSMKCELIADLLVVHKHAAVWFSGNALTPTKR
jgi:hypothetical protein